MKWCVVLAALGCGNDAPTLRPFIEVPDGTDPYGQLEDIELAVARNGSDTNIVAASFRPGQPMSLPEVAFEDDLVVHMIGFAHGAELAYGRTCSLDLAGRDLPDRPHLYFANVFEWAPAPPPASDALRTGAHAYTLTDGSALFVGGGANVDTAVRFQPLDGTFAALETTVAARRGALIVPLADGDDRALIVGGIDGGGDAVGFLEVVNPTAAADQQRRLVNGGPRIIDHAAVTLVGGGVLVAGGRFQPDDTSLFAVSAQAWIFRLGQGGLMDPSTSETVPLLSGRASATLTRLDDTRGVVLVAGGLGSDGQPVASSELFFPADGVFVDGPDLTEPRFGHAAVRTLDGFVVLVGGYSAPGVPIATLEVFDPLAGFQAPRPLPPGAGLTDLTATLLPDGRILLAGGVDASGEPTSAVYVIDPAGGAFDVQRIGDLGVPRASHAAALLCDGTVLVVGGADEAHASERLDPPSAGRRR